MNTAARARTNSTVATAFLPAFLPPVLAALLCACGSAPVDSTAATAPPSRNDDADALLVVDCLLPPQVRQLGAFATGVSPRRPAKLSARECAAAGGEYAVASRDAAAALKLWLPFARDGDAQAQTQVGEMYERGVGSVADPAAAAEWYRRAAQQGEARAMVNLASLLERGLGVERDPERAAQWFRRAGGLKPAPSSLAIHLLDPLVILPAALPDTMPRTVTLAAAPEAQTLTGRVIGSASVRSVSVNGRVVAVDAQGVFRIVPESGPLLIAATDTQGRSTSVALTLARADNAAAAAGDDDSKAARRAGAALVSGTAHALIITNQNYQHWPSLDTPLKDGRDLKAMLERRFGFKTTLLANATRRDILDALNTLRNKLGPDDGLLVFYAGHGEVDPVTRRGYWIPADGERRGRSRWISVLDVTDQLNAIAARQVLVVADSCYSGTMARSALSSADAAVSAASRLESLRTLQRLRARVAMTSGGDEPVADGGAGRNSLFARSLLDVLAAVHEPIEAQRVFAELSARFGLRAHTLKLRQRPDYAPIRFAGHEAGDFVFVPKN